MISIIKHCLFVPILSVLMLSVAEAQTTIKAHIVVVPGPDALLSEDLAPVWGAAHEHLSRTGVTVNAVRLTQMFDIAPELATLNLRVSRLVKWRAYAKKHKFGRGVDLVHVILPPIYDGGLNWFAGVAYRICGDGPEAISYSTAGYNIDGYFQGTKSAIGIAHEIGHTLGAKHTNTNDLMNTGALALVNTTWPLSVSPTTIKEIKKCQRKRKAGRKAARKAANF